MKKIKAIMIINGIIVASIVLLDFLFFKEVSSLFSSIIIIAIVMFFVPIALVRCYEAWKVRTLEDFFPQFMRDLVESVRSGMTLPQAIESVSENDYGPLSSHIKRVNAQLNWGIPFENALLKFSRGTRSKLIGRIATTIIESHRFGGNLTDIFDAISTTSVEVERLREERKLYINSQLITGYIIFFVFLVVIIGLEKYLVPTLSQPLAGELSAQASPQDMSGEYKAMFRNLIMLQGLFAGLVIGKMAEGAVTGGIKHSLFLFIAGLLIYTITTG
ncbi:MAG: type II secretion system F family protein [Candidatus Aenigmarchaeota archaeon]|nr:type II secretion system F family protein [Candidatus Aenigmarchaeota archaeon]